MIYIAGAGEWGPAVTGFRFYPIALCRVLIFARISPWLNLDGMRQTSC